MIQHRPLRYQNPSSISSTVRSFFWIPWLLSCYLSGTAEPKLYLCPITHTITSQYSTTMYNVLPSIKYLCLKIPYKFKNFPSTRFLFLKKDFFIHRFLLLNKDFSKDIRLRCFPWTQCITHFNYKRTVGAWEGDVNSVSWDKRKQQEVQLHHAVKSIPHDINSKNRESFKRYFDLLKWLNDIQLEKRKRHIPE